MKETGKRRLLVVAFFFPPVLTGGVFRPLRFVKFLGKFGWMSTVLTVSRARHLDQDLALQNEIPENVQVFRVPHLSLDGFRYRLKRAFIRSGKGEGSMGEKGQMDWSGNKVNSPHLLTILRSLLSSLVRGVQFLLIPDEQITWVPGCFMAGLRLIKASGASVVLTTSPPNSAHLIGFLLKKFTGVKWVADFRDPWFSHWFGVEKRNVFYKSRFRIESRIERGIVNSADRIICVGNGDREQLQSKINGINRKKLHVIWNGYNEQEFIQGPCQMAFNKKFVVGHFGYLYKGTADEFFLAVESLLEEDEELRENMEIRFVGHVYEEYAERIRASKYRDNFVLFGQLDHRAAISHMYQCDILLVSLGGDIFGSEHIPGKIFEYMAVKKRVLAIAPENGEAVKFLKESGLGLIVDTGDFKSIKDVLKRVYKARLESQDQIDVNEEFLKQFSGLNLTARLASLLDDIGN